MNVKTPYASLEGLTPSTSYTFTVSAFDANGNESSVSSSVSFTTKAPDTQDPTEPTSLAYSNITPYTVDLSWNTSTDNEKVKEYDIYNGASLLLTVSHVDGAIMNMTVENLIASTEYKLTVKARDLVGNVSQASNEVVFSTLENEPPSAPENLVATNIAMSTVDLLWEASFDNVGVVGYIVYQNYKPIDTVSVLNYNIKGLVALKSYSFYVKAIDAAGNISNRSNKQYITTLDTGAPTAPSNLVADSVTSTTLTLRWDKSVDNIAVEGYLVFQDGEQIASVTDTLYRISELTDATSYSYHVKAFDAAGNKSEASNTVSLTTDISDVRAMLDVNIYPNPATHIITLSISDCNFDLGWR
jgi:chitodextrinase